jgi:hypothetical protein
MHRLALSYYPPLYLGLVLAAIHLAWGVWGEPQHRGEVVSGYGSCLIVLGLLVAARPYVLGGREAATTRAMKPPLQQAAMSREHSATYHQEREAERSQVRSSVIAERETSVVMIAIGTLLNGYGPPLIRVLGLGG